MLGFVAVLRDHRWRTADNQLPDELLRFTNWWGNLCKGQRNEGIRILLVVTLLRSKSTVNIDGQATTEFVVFSFMFFTQNELLCKVHKHSVQCVWQELAIPAPLPSYPLPCKCVTSNLDNQAFIRIGIKPVIYEQHVSSDFITSFANNIRNNI